MLLSVQISEATSTQVHVSRLYELVWPVDLYDELLGVMTIAKLEKLWYKTARGKGHTSLVRTYMIEQLWHDDRSPTAREGQRQKLSSQISLGSAYKALQDVFDGRVLLLIPESWTRKRYLQALSQLCRTRLDSGANAMAVD